MERLEKTQDEDKDKEKDKAERQVGSGFAALSLYSLLLNCPSAAPPNAQPPRRALVEGA